MTGVPRSLTIPHLRWIIAGILCAATLLNYLDRQALGIVSVDIRREFHLSEQDYATILSFFLFAYGIMYAVSGYIVDRLGTRRGFAIFIVGWSGAQLLHGFARGRTSLSVYRFLLGAAEPGAWPAAARAVNEWFPAEQRALAMGIFNAGTSIGSILGPVVVASVTLVWGWRAAFVITGGAGLLWLIAWLVLYQPPARNRFLRPAEYAKFRALLPSAAESEPAGRNAARGWVQLMRTRGCWTLMLTRFLTDPVIYFVIFWFPEYLRRERGFNLEMVRDYAWVPFAVGGIAYVAGGWLSGRLMRAGWPPGRARKLAMAIGAACLPIAMIAPGAATAAVAVVCICFITLGHGLWAVNLQTIPTDLYPDTEVGTVTGLSGAAGALGGLLAQFGTAYVVTYFSYTPVFLLAGLVHPLSALLTYALLPERCFDDAVRRNAPGRL